MTSSLRYQMDGSTGVMFKTNSRQNLHVTGKPNAHAVHVLHIAGNGTTMCSQYVTIVATPNEPPDPLPAVLDEHSLQRGAAGVAVYHALQQQQPAYSISSVQARGRVVEGMDPVSLTILKPESSALCTTGLPASNPGGTYTVQLQGYLRDVMGVGKAAPAIPGDVQLLTDQTIQQRIVGAVQLRCPHLDVNAIQFKAERSSVLGDVQLVTWTVQLELQPQQLAQLLVAWTWGNLSGDIRAEEDGELVTSRPKLLVLQPSTGCVSESKIACVNACRNLLHHEQDMEPHKPSCIMQAVSHSGHGNPTERRW